MERLTEKTTRSLMEAYAAVYNEELRNELEEKKLEEELIDNFVEFIDALIEEGYDLSNCKYEDLCDVYISYLEETYVLEEGIGSAVGGFLKKEGGRLLTKYGPRAAEAGKRLLKSGLKQGGEAVKSVLSPVGHVWKGTLGTKSPLRNPWGAAAAGTAAAGIAAVRSGLKPPSIPSITKPKPSQPTPSETPAERATRQRNELKVVGGGSGGYVSKMEPSSSKYKESQALADKLTAQQLRQQRKTPVSTPQRAQPPQQSQLEIDQTTGQIKIK